MKEALFGFESRGKAACGLLEARSDALELGSWVAALCEETEDEFELDLRFRAVVDSGRLRGAFGVEFFPEALSLEN